ncbi:MAG: Hsp20/alpha crystallin family protein [Anaerolineae bacterium]|nr:Hsp20/alpha crystallin family protein [Anaerolineae bacterium]
MSEKKSQPGETKEGAKVTFDLGFGGLFKGLGDFIDLLGDMIETGEEEVTRSGEFRVKGLGDKGRGVYGFSVRSGIGGIPRVERFGNIRATEEGPVVAEVREPLVDLFDEEQEIVVVAELPGVGEEEVHVEIQDDILSLETTGERKYAKEILLPEPVDAATLQKAYKNGILELRLKKAKAEE